mmetsp:Transcript_7729/g.24210  ORF Transcript_7729/g.24210 Transcript_7729/m.24210 type:complete len:156 (+) Transcript_7729:237-704(+)
MVKAWNYAGETLLRESRDEVAYTIIRPGIMSRADPVAGDPPRSLALVDNGRDLKVTPITHAAIAKLCVACLDAPNAAGSTLSAMTVQENQGEDAWEPLLATVAPDRRAFPSRAATLTESRRAAAVGGAILVAVAATSAALPVALAVGLVRFITSR